MCAPLEADWREAETSADLRATTLADGELSNSCVNNAAVKKLKIKQSESGQEGRGSANTADRYLRHICTPGR